MAGGELNLRRGTPGSRPLFGANLGALALGKGTASAVLLAAATDQSSSPWGSLVLSMSDDLGTLPDLTVFPPNYWRN